MKIEKEKRISFLMIDLYYKKHKELSNGEKEELKNNKKEQVHLDLFFFVSLNFSLVVGKKFGRYDIGSDTGISHFLRESVNVGKGELSNFGVHCLVSSVLTCASTEYDDIQK